MFLCGTAGLGSVMRTDQRVRCSRNQRRRRGAGSSSSHTLGHPAPRKQSYWLGTAETAGVDALGAVPPYFMKPDEESIIKHFKTIAEASKLPLYIYNIPGQAVNAVTPAMMLKLAEIPNIKGCEG